MNKSRWMAGIALAISLWVVMCSGASMAGAQEAAPSQPAESASHETDAERIAALEEKLEAVEERLVYLENKLGENTGPLVASNGTIPASALAESGALNKAAANLPVPAVQNSASQARATALIGAGPEGFFIESPKRDFHLNIRYQIDLDGRFAVNRNEQGDPNTFYLRRAEPILDGMLYGRFHFRVLTNFGLGKVTVPDSYIDTLITPALTVRVGKFKGPIGLERLMAGTMLPLMERALPTQLVPNRDVGVELFGDLAKSRFSYTVGVFNGSPDAGSNDGNTDDHKELAGRIFVQPFRQTGFTHLAGLAFGVGGSYEDVQGSPASTALGSYSSTGQRTFFQYRSDGTSLGTVVAGGVHSRWSPQGYFYTGPFGLMGEYILSSQDVRKGASTATMDHAGWQLVTSYVLTGENGSYSGVEPARPFDPAAGAWGAFEVAARYSVLSVDKGAFPDFADPATYAREAKAWALGLNWYLSHNIKVVFGFEQTRFTSAAPGVSFDNESLFQQRMQLRF